MCFVGDQYQSAEIHELSNHTALRPALSRTSKRMEMGVLFVVKVKTHRYVIRRQAPPSSDTILLRAQSILLLIRTILCTFILQSYFQCIDEYWQGISIWDKWSWNARMLDLCLVKEDVQSYTVKCSDFDVLVWSICRVSHSFFFLSRVSRSQETKCVLDRKYLSAHVNGAARRRESERFH